MYDLDSHDPPVPTPDAAHDLSDLAYFDHNATTPLDPRVRDAMVPWLSGLHGNPSSAHAAGRAARAAVERARAQVASMLGAQPEDVIFPSSGSEANNMVIRAVAEAHGHRGHLIHGPLEHPSIRQAVRRLEGLGMEATELFPDADGRIRLADLDAALRDDTRLVSLMLANNVLGTLQPVAEASMRCRAWGVPVLCDAVQAVGKIEVDVTALAVDFLVLGGHKFHAPAGIAALWIRPGTDVLPLIQGAAQERGLRASTENVPAIVGLGVACGLVQRELDERHHFLRHLRDRFEDGLRHLDGAEVLCQESLRLPHTSYVVFHGQSGHELMWWLDQHGCAVSTGSACHSGKPQPNTLLQNMGRDDVAYAGLRVSFGMTNTDDDVDRLLARLGEYLAAHPASP